MLFCAFAICDVNIDAYYPFGTAILTVRNSTASLKDRELVAKLRSVVEVVGVVDLKKDPESCVANDNAIVHYIVRIALFVCFVRYEGKAAADRLLKG
jgi:hypothetical protein